MKVLEIWPKFQKKKQVCKKLDKTQDIKLEIR